MKNSCVQWVVKGLATVLPYLLIQICNTTWYKAGDMPSIVTAIIAAGRNWTIDYNAQACDVVIKVFTCITCIKTAWNRVRNMFATVLTTITTVWRPSSSFTGTIKSCLFYALAPLCLIRKWKHWLIIFFHTQAIDHYLRLVLDGAICLTECFEFKMYHCMKLKDLSAAVLFKLARSCLNAFNFIQWYIISLKESARQIARSKTSLKLQLHSNSLIHILLLSNSHNNVASI